MIIPETLPNKEIINPKTGAVILEPMTEEEYVAAMPALVYPVATEGAAE